MGSVPSQDGINGFGELRNVAESVFVKWSANFLRQRCKYGWIATWFQFVFVHQEINPIAQLARVKPKDRLIFFAGREQLLCQDVKTGRVLILDCVSKLFDRQGRRILSRSVEDRKNNESYEEYRSHLPNSMRFGVHYEQEILVRLGCL